MFGVNEKCHRPISSLVVQYQMKLMAEEYDRRKTVLTTKYSPLKEQ